MKIYFSGSISGGREYIKVYEKIISKLQHYGDVLTEHIADPALSSGGENLESKAVFERDLEFLKAADIVIAEVTTPSLGVGWEIAWAGQNGRKTHALFHEGAGRRLSAMIDGNPDVTVHRYADHSEIPELLKTIFRKS